MEIAQKMNDFLYGKEAMMLFGNRRMHDEEMIRKGKSQTQEENAMRMLKDNMSLEDVSKYTGLSLKKVKNLQSVVIN